MPFAVGVKFKEDEFSKYFNPGDLKFQVEDFCLVKDPEIGIERVGLVSSVEGRAAIQMLHLPKVIRPATDEEVQDWYELKIREKDALDKARESAIAHNLPIKISAVTFLPEKQQVLIYFTSDQRVDFREMVRDLAGQFKSRIEMWQIGARKEAGLMNGMGICGQQLCCSSWLKEFPSISMRHAKEQDIVQPPSKLSGPCGRLRCCLRYEHEQYVALSVGAPALGCAGGCGAKAGEKGACGIVIDRSILKQTATVRLEGGDIQVVPFDEFVASEIQPPPSERPERPDRGGDRYERPERPDRRGGGVRRGPPEGSGAGPGNGNGNGERRAPGDRNRRQPESRPRGEAYDDEGPVREED